MREGSRKREEAMGAFWKKKVDVLTWKMRCPQKSLPPSYIYIYLSSFFFFLAMVVLNNLEPNTTYEIKVAAVNGKGQGEYSKTETFQTLPVRK